jgi:hypothetical protein
MALARTQVLTENTFFGGVGTGVPFVYTTGSFTPPANSLLVAHFGIVNGPGTGCDNRVGLASVTGGSLTWTKRLGPTGAASDNPYASATSYTSAGEVWTAPVGGSPASMTIVATSSCNNASDGARGLIEVEAYTGYDTGSPIGATASAAIGFFITGNDTASLTLSASPASSSIVQAGLHAETFGANSTAAPGSGWTEIYDQGTSLDGYGAMQGQVRTGSTSTSVDWNNTSAGQIDWGTWLYAIEIKEAAGGATSPVVPIPAPSSQPPPYPAQLRTWTSSYNPNLVGKDVFPPGRKGIVFDGPPKGPRPAGPTWTSRYNDNLIGKDVFPPGRIVSERPPPITWRRDWTLNLLQSTLAPTAATLPFRQQDWPLPGRAAQPDRTWVSSAISLQLRLPPPGDIWTDLPPAPLFWRNGSTLNLLLTTLVAQDAFPPGVVRSERPPPLDWRNSWTLSLLQSTLAPGVAVPFAQYDWPLPRVASQPDRTWVSFFNPNLVGQDAFPPGVVRTERLQPLSWRNGFELNLVLSTLATVVQFPLNQYDWPLPGQGWQPTRTWTSSYNINLIAKDQLPVRQMDWPLPMGYVYPANVRVAVPLNINLFPPPVPPVVTQEYRNVKVAGGEFGFMGLRGGVIG